MIQVHEPDPDKVEQVYNAVFDTLLLYEAEKPTAIAALLIILGTQYNEGSMSPEQMQTFAKDSTEWMTAYFSKTTAIVHRKGSTK